MEAISEALLEKTKILIDREADVNVRDREGKTALRLAKELYSISMVEILRQVGAKE